jgi:hypothetical protein
VLKEGPHTGGPGRSREYDGSRQGDRGAPLIVRVGVLRQRNPVPRSRRPGPDRTRRGTPLASSLCLVTGRHRQRPSRGDRSRVAWVLCRLRDA